MRGETGSPSVMRGRTAYICYDAYMKRTTVFLPDDVHEALRQEAFRSRKSMAEVIRLRIQIRPNEVASKTRQSARLVDPLMKVAGICRGNILSPDIDEELYG